MLELLQKHPDWEITFSYTYAHIHVEFSYVTLVILGHKENKSFGLTRTISLDAVERAANKEMFLMWELQQNEVNFEKAIAERS